MKSMQAVLVKRDGVAVHTDLHLQQVFRYFVRITSELRT